MPLRYRQGYASFLKKKYESFADHCLFSFLFVLDPELPLNFYIIMSFLSCQVCPNTTKDPWARSKHFFAFPRDPSLRLAWFEKISQPPTRNVQIFVCSDHFEKSCFQSVELNGNKTIALKMGSVPTLYLNRLRNNFNNLTSSSGNTINVATHPMPSVQEKEKPRFSSNVMESKELSPKPSTSKSSNRNSRYPQHREKSAESSHEKNTAGKHKRRKSFLGFTGGLISCEGDISQEEFEEKVILLQKQFSSLIHILLKTKELIDKKNEISLTMKRCMDRSIAQLFAKYKVIQSDIKIVTNALDLHEVVPELERKLKGIVDSSEKIKVIGQSEKVLKRKLCCVPKCESDSSKFPIKAFFPVPANSSKRAQWFFAIKFNSSSPEDKYVCDDHFTLEEIENYENFIPKIDLMSSINAEKKVNKNDHKLQIFVEKWNLNLDSLLLERNRLGSSLLKWFEQQEKRTGPISDMWMKFFEKKKRRLIYLQKQIENMTFLSSKEVQTGFNIDRLLIKIEKKIGRNRPKNSTETEKTDSLVERNKNEIIRHCFVKGCFNTDISSPFKIFIQVPNEASSRAKWFKYARNESLSSGETFYCCEDHFTKKDIKILCQNENSANDNNIFPSFFLPNWNDKQSSNCFTIQDSKCLVPSCPNRSNQGKMFYVVPTNQELRKKWFQSICFTSDRTSGLFVCEDHFVESDFVVTEKGKYLKPTSVPEIKKEREKLKTEIKSHFEFLSFLTLLTSKSLSAVDGLKQKSLEHVKDLINVFKTYKNSEKDCFYFEIKLKEIENFDSGTLDLFTISDDNIKKLQIDLKFKEILIRAKKNSVYIISDTEEDEMPKEVFKGTDNTNSAINDFFTISDDSDDDVSLVPETIMKEDVIILSGDEMDGDLASKSESSEEIKMTNVVKCNSSQAFDGDIVDDFECEERKVFDFKCRKLEVEDVNVFDSKGFEKIEENGKIEVNENVNKTTKQKEKMRVSVLDMELSDLEEEYYEEPELLLCNTDNLSKLCDTCQDKNGLDLCPKCVPVQLSETMLIINEFEETPKFCPNCGDEIESECEQCINKNKKKKVTKKSIKFNKRLRLNHQCPVCSEGFRTKNDLDRHLEDCL